MRRIGLCGAQGTGKSTLSGALAEELRLPLIEEQARIAAKLFGITRPSRDMKERPELALAFEIQCLILQLQSEEQNKRGFVSDRTLIDIAVYWNKWLAHKSPTVLNRFIYELCEHRSQTYDLVVYVPPEIVLVNDRFRSTDPDYQAEMDFLMRAMLKVCNPRTWIKVTGTVKERVNQVISVIKSNPSRMV